MYYCLSNWIVVIKLIDAYYQLLFIITITNYQYFRHNVTKRRKTEQSRHETSNYTLISLVPFIIITINNNIYILTTH